MFATSTRRNDNLKVMAMLTMLIDHMGHMHLVPDAWYTASRTIGRIAFPIFAYQIAVGFEKTSNRTRYALRLFVFGVIAQIPYIWFNPEGNAHWLHFNIMFLLLAGLGVLKLSEKAGKAWRRYRSSEKPVLLLVTVAWAGLLMAALALPEAATILCLKAGIDFSFEYSSYGLLMILFFYYFRKSPWKMLASYFCLSLVGVLLTTLWVAVKYGPQITGGDLAYFQALASSETIKMLLFGNGNHLRFEGVWFQARSTMAVPIILLLESYQGKFQIHLPRAVGYGFYPVHIAILTIIKSLIVVS